MAVVKPQTWLVLVVSTAIVLAGYQYHTRSMSRLEGEIKARGESIAQLSQLAAVKDKDYAQARDRFVALRQKIGQTTGHNPSVADSTIEACSQVILTCDQRDSVKTSAILLLNKQIESYKKLSRKGKLFGFLPRPTVQAGVCVDRRVKPDLCLSAGFPILK